MNLESPKVTVEKSAEYLYTALSEVKKYEKENFTDWTCLSGCK